MDIVHLRDTALPFEGASEVPKAQPASKDVKDQALSIPVHFQIEQQRRRIVSLWAARGSCELDTRNLACSPIIAR
jgi:hypothetical protein